jgi:hypothetical protein
LFQWVSFIVAEKYIPYYNSVMPRLRRNLPPKLGGMLRRWETWGHLTVIEILDEYLPPEEWQYCFMCDCGNECFVRAPYFTDKHQVKCCEDVDKLDTGYIASGLNGCPATPCNYIKVYRRDTRFPKEKKPMGRPKSADPGTTMNFYVPDSIKKIIKEASEEEKVTLSKAMADLVRTGKMFRDSQEAEED